MYIWVCHFLIVNFVFAPTNCHLLKSDSLHLFVVGLHCNTMFHCIISLTNTFPVMVHISICIYRYLTNQIILLSLLLTDCFIKIWQLKTARNKINCGLLQYFWQHFCDVTCYLSFKLTFQSLNSLYRLACLLANWLWCFSVDMWSL